MGHSRAQIEFCLQHLFIKKLRTLSYYDTTLDIIIYFLSISIYCMIKEPILCHIKQFMLCEDSLNNKTIATLSLPAFH